MTSFIQNNSNSLIFNIPAPIDLTIWRVGANEISIYWSLEYGIFYYGFEIFITPVGFYPPSPPAFAGSTLFPDFQVTNLQPGTTYDIFVRGIGADGERSLPSNVVRATTL